MADKLVSIRMPKSLAKELRNLVQEHHYIDLSEELRSIIRQGAKKQLDPINTQIHALKKRIEEDIHATNAAIRKRSLVKELKTLLETEGDI